MDKLLTKIGVILSFARYLIFLLILFLIFAGGEGTQQKGANLAQLSLSGAIMDDSEILEKIVDKTIRELEAGLKNVKFSQSGGVIEQILLSEQATGCFTFSDDSRFLAFAK